MRMAENECVEYFRSILWHAHRVSVSNAWSRRSWSSGSCLRPMRQLPMYAPFVPAPALGVGRSHGAVLTAFKQSPTFAVASRKEEGAVIESECTRCYRRINLVAYIWREYLRRVDYSRHIHTVHTGLTCKDISECHRWAFELKLTAPTDCIRNDKSSPTSTPLCTPAVYAILNCLLAFAKDRPADWCGLPPDLYRVRLHTEYERASNMKLN